MTAQASATTPPAPQPDLEQRVQVLEDIVDSHERRLHSLEQRVTALEAAATDDKYANRYGGY